MSTFLRIARRGVERIEALFDAAFTPAWNPLFHLGALGWFFYWIVLVSGIYLFAFFDTGITEAYDSVEYMTHQQWYAAGIMRSLHRYASDAMVLVVMLHLFRELVMDRLRGVRWFSWLTGVPLLWFIYASGISGYWLVWDQLAQYVAIATSEWLDALPLFGEPIARNFLNEPALTGRFFTLMVFIHIAAPLMLLFGMWIHIQRIAHANVNPPKGLAFGTLVMMVGLSLAYPAVSQGRADLDTVPAQVGLDWFYLLAYPLLDTVPGLALWAFFIGGTVLLFGLPWLPLKKRDPVAVVDLDNCNGCGRCFVDCPYQAISMDLRSDGGPYEQEAVVLESKCASCGICVGACPTATPFRSAGELVPGIDLPALPARDIREQALDTAARLEGKDRVIAFNCAHGPDLSRLQGPRVAVISIACAAHLPPSFLDFIISRKHADGVFFTGCREGDCYHRLGIEWIEQRTAGRRDPYLRRRVPRERIARVWLGLASEATLERELNAFRARLRELEPAGRKGADSDQGSQVREVAGGA